MDSDIPSNKDGEVKSHRHLADMGDGKDKQELTKMNIRNDHPRACF